ncbi:hypothetical protein [Kitasatospora sp. NPDC098663]
MERSMAFAALCFVTLVPLLIVIAAASATRGNGIGLGTGSPTASV